MADSHISPEVILVLNYAPDRQESMLKFGRMLQAALQQVVDIRQATDENSRTSAEVGSLIEALAGQVQAGSKVIERLAQQSEQIEVVLISGDIYDRALPHVDAVQLCNWVLRELRATGATVVGSRPVGQWSKTNTSPVLGLTTAGVSTPSQSQSPRLT